MGKSPKDKGKKKDRIDKHLRDFDYTFTITDTQEEDFRELTDEVIGLFRAAGRYAVKVRALIPADNRNKGHIVSPMHIGEIGDICMLLMMDDAGFAPDGINNEGMFEIGIFITSAQMAKALGGTGRAAHAIGAMMMDAEEQRAATDE